MNTTTKVSPWSMRNSNIKLARELEGMKLLQKISSLLIEDESGEGLYQQILDAAMASMRADFSSIQMLDAERAELRLLGWKNFHPKSAAYWQTVSLSTGTSCGSALSHGQRIIVPDVNAAEVSVINRESLRHYQLSGIVSVQSTPLTTREGRVIGMISTHWRKRHEPSEDDLALFDVLVRQAADVLERRRVQEALREADRRKDEFLAVLAHELRNPLFPVKNALYLLQHTEGHTSNHQQLIQMMERQINHIVRLVDDLLEASRIATGKIELRKETINLLEVINTAIEVSKPLLDSNQHQLILSLPTEPLMINADMVRMTQVFANLLNNAAKYTPKNGVITVNVTFESNNIVISVRDSGIGISADVLPNVFEIFFTQDKHTIDPNHKGLGIGLAMVRSLVELHEGTVKAHSAGHNQGSEFIVRLPLNENKKRIEDNKLVEPEQNSSLVNLRVLIVDDNLDITNSFAMLLNSWEINVHAVNSGQSALAVLDEFNPHIVLLDIGMPDMDGYEVAEKIRQNPQYDSIKLVALTGWSQEKDLAHSQASGFIEHLAKPVDANILRKLLNKLR